MSMQAVTAAAEMRKLIEEVMRFLGLDFFEIQVMSVPGHEPMFRIHLTKDFTFPSGMDPTTMAGVYKAIPTMLGPLRESILNSTEMQQHIRESKERAEKAEADAQQNRDYRTHFELEMRLRHGGPK